MHTVATDLIFWSLSASSLARRVKDRQFSVARCCKLTKRPFALCPLGNAMTSPVVNIGACWFVSVYIWSQNVRRLDCVP